MSGRIFAVGLGPGAPEAMTVEAAAVLERCHAVVGYTGYVELLDPELLAGRTVVATGMRGEVERCRRAVALAAEGADVAVVCSGDAGVYAMAGLLLEVLEAEGLEQDVGFEAVPGVPAFVAAAALLGAPLMHDFAAVSLSDLLTPWEAIARRVEAAAGVDFVLAVYNPRSTRRTGHLAEALEIIARHRRPHTPVGVVKNARREGQQVRVTTLAGLDVGQVDMLTTLVVGNSATRVTAGRMLTPRGYHRKYDLEGA